ncbi:MAG: hypothetical protein QOD65_2693 [Gaiellales bacterium]|nr:hypothetical protein [Gaiellales bacterium]
MTARTQRILAITLLAAAAAGLIALYVGLLMRSPQEVRSPRGAGKERPAELTLQTVGALGPNYDGNPNWVSYLVRDSRGKWIHSTSLELPAHALVQVTIRQYDTATGLRNPFFARPQGTSGNVVQVDGKTVDVINPDLSSHTFAVPQLGVYVPLPGVADNAKNQCAAAPCTLAQAHRTISFSFRTGGRGRYRWQCFVPCGAGFIAGFGGPMQRFGYMDGYLDVV